MLTKQRTVAIESLQTDILLFISVNDKTFGCGSDSALGVKYYVLCTDSLVVSIAQYVHYRGHMCTSMSLFREVPSHKGHDRRMFNVFS